MFDPSPFIDLIGRRLPGLIDRLPAGEGLLSVTLAMPDLPFRALPAGLDDAVFWARPEDDAYLLGLDSVARWEESGPGRLGRLAARLAAAGADWPHLSPDGLDLPAPAFTAFAFSDDTESAFESGLPNAVVRVPLVTFQRRGQVRGATFTWDWRRGGRDCALAAWTAAATAGIEAMSRTPSPAPCPNPIKVLATDPDDATFVERVQAAVSDIGAGRLEKVVLTRRVRVAAPRPFDAARLMTTLAWRYPGCVLFACSGPRGAVVAATPERLVALSGTTVHSEALAGTLRRDPHEDRDRLLGEALCRSVKDRHEHDLVVRSIVEALAPVCDDVSHPGQPELLRLRSLQHLRTPITARARHGTTVLDLAERLHPTPAVGGVPQAAALDWLTDHGERRHGWYTGAFGWVEPGGQGEVSVTLRCALIDGAGAVLSAGAGIVAESNPYDELEETELKLGAMLDALEDG